MLKSLAISVTDCCLAFFPSKRVADLFIELVRRRVGRLSPADALRCLFDLDSRLYGLEGEYAVLYGNGTHPKHRLTGYHDFFVQRINRGERVLDIGCGIGEVAFDVAERASAHVVAVDIDAEKIASAKKNNPHPRVDYQVGDGLALVSHSTFDVIVLSNVIEHLSDRVAFLCNLQNMIKPCRFLIRVPLFERDWRVPMKRELGVEWRLDPTHETEYTLESFSTEIAAAGLVITHIEVRWGEIWSEVRGGPE